MTQRNVALFLTALGWLGLLATGGYVLWDADWEPHAVAIVLGTLLAVMLRNCAR